MALPFDPLRETLYTPDELFDTFDVGDATSYERCTDLAILSYFVRMGKNPARQSGASTLEAMHDNSISRAIQKFLERNRNVVAIMGGHDMIRGDDAYKEIAHISQELTQRGFLLASGGGPGAMEATHLGALFSQRDVAELDSCVHSVGAAAPKLPRDIGGLVKPDGTVDSAIAAELHSWLAPAFEILGRVPKRERGMSLGVPTWLYGYEPTTLFSAYSAKYFQNSVREDGLVTLGVRGIIFTEGSAGTIQEIFQDAAQNYYGKFYPMVFLSSPGRRYWEKQLPVRALIEALLGSHPGYKNVLFTDAATDVVSFLATHLVN
jgi:predicted Rossmann-fold nucleotide-binding protein